MRKWLACAAGALLASLASLAFADSATIYRWKDADGRVNYGNLPPPGVRAQPLDAAGRVTVVPALERPVPVAPARPDESERLERLERELEAERQLRHERDQAAIERELERARSRSECEEKYREPCDEDGHPVGRRFIVVPMRPAFPPAKGKPVQRPPEAVGQRPEAYGRPEGKGRPEAQPRPEGRGRPEGRQRDDSAAVGAPAFPPRRRVADDITRPDERRPVPR